MRPYVNSLEMQILKKLHWHPTRIYYFYLKINNKTNLGSISVADPELQIKGGGGGGGGRRSQDKTRQDNVLFGILYSPMYIDFIQII